MYERLDTLDSAARGQVQQRIDHIASLKADAAVAQDVEPPALERVVAADRVYISDEPELLAGMLLDADGPADVYVHIADVDRRARRLDVGALQLQIARDCDPEPEIERIEDGRQGWRRRLGSGGFRRRDFRRGCRGRFAGGRAAQHGGHGGGGGPPQA